MALSNEEENFVKISKILFNVVQPYLRKLFITKWEEKYPNEIWQSNNKSGNALVAKIAKVNKHYADKLKAGDEQQWETAILVYVFLYSGLNLIDQCRNPKETRVPPLRISEEIEIIRDIRNNVFGHAQTMSCTSHDFSVIVDKLKSAARNIFGANAEKEIDDIVKVQIETPSTANLRQRLEDEKNRNDQFSQSLKDAEKEINDVIKASIETQSTANLKQRLEDQRNSKDQLNQSLEESKQSMKLPTEDANYVKMGTILSSTVPKYLSKYFITLWNNTYQEWQSGSTSGEFLVNKISSTIKHNEKNREMIENLKSGNALEWDITTLAFLFLSSDLNLIEGQRSTAFDFREEIKLLMDIANTFFATKSNWTYPSDEYADNVAKIKRFFMNIPLKDAVQEIDDIDNSPMERKMNIKKRQLQDKQTSRNKEIDQSSMIFKEYQPILELPTNKANFIIMKNLLVNFVPKHLRQLFRKQWDIAYREQKWQSNKLSGECLVSKLPASTNNTTIKVLQTGNEESWNSETLIFLLHCSDLQLIDPCRHESQRKEPLLSSEEIDLLLCIEKKFFSVNHKSMLYPSDEFRAAVETIKKVAKNVFGKAAGTEVCDMVKEQMKKIAGESQSTVGVKKLELVDCKSPVEQENQSEAKVQVDNFDSSSEQENVHENLNDIATLKEKENFLRITIAVLNIVPKYLRICFKEHWNIKYSTHKWKSDKESGDFLIKEIPEDIKKNPRNHKNITNLETGDEESWDTTTLVFAMLYSGLELIPTCRPATQRSTPLRISEEIDRLREIRNSVFAHATSASINSGKFTEIKDSIKSIAKKIFCKPAVNDIEKIDKYRVVIATTDERRQQVEMEIERAKELEQVIAEYNIMKVSGNLKELYKRNCKMHKVHRIEDKGRIVQEELDVEEFAVNVTISDSPTPEDTLQNELSQLRERLIGAKSTNIDLGNLIDSKSRVTFVRGIAGIGKSVLTKQLALRWSWDKIYQNYRLCIMFECRHLNEFYGSNKESIQEDKLLEKFIEERSKYDVRHVENILFLIDGLDELYDINSDNNSVIWQMLDIDRCKYHKSKVIITGRPNVEHKLSNPKATLGGLRKVEIQGLSDEEIKKYISKFTSDDERKLQISKAIETAKGILPIVYVPQFLNTFCCTVTLMEEGEAVNSTAELYCWTVYLLMKQHAQRQGISEITSSKLFHYYSSELRSLAEVCHNLLEENQIIVNGDIKEKIIGSEEGKKFIQGLFVDVSSNTEKYQFKHLSLMEFLSAFHICTKEQCLKTIEEILAKGHIDIVVYTCELIAAFPCKKIVEEMVVDAGKQKTIDVSLEDILALVAKCNNFNRKTKFQRSLDILMCFTTSQNANKQCILQCLKMLHCDSQFKSDLTVSYKLRNIINHLTYLCECSVNDIQYVLSDIHIGEFVVNDLEAVKCIKYLGIVDMIDFNSIQCMHADAARYELSNWNKKDATKCTLVWIEECNFDEKETVTGSEAMNSNSNLDELVIWNSKLNKNNFINLSRWGASCKKVILDQLKIEDDLFFELVKAIEEKKDLRMEELVINRCTTLKEQWQKTILQHGVTLIIDGHKKEPAATYTSRPGPSTSRPQSPTRKRSLLPIGTTEDQAHSSPKAPAVTSTSRPGPSTASPQLPTARPQSSTRKRSSIPIGTTEDEDCSSQKEPAATYTSRAGPSTASPQGATARPQSSARESSSMPIQTSEDKAHSSPKVPPSEQGLQSASSSTNENTKPSKGSQSCHCLLS